MKTITQKDKGENTQKKKYSIFPLIFKTEENLELTMVATPCMLEVIFSAFGIATLALHRSHLLSTKKCTI